MKVAEALGTARDALSVRRVFAEPYEKDGLTVIAAATVTGGAGGGSGTDPKGQQGEGGGFAANARPMGAFVIKDSQVHWRPAIDLNRIITFVGLIIIAYLLRRPRSRSLTRGTPEPPDIPGRFTPQVGRFRRRPSRWCLRLRRRRGAWAWPRCWRICCVGSATR